MKNLLLNLLLITILTLNSFSQTTNVQEGALEFDSTKHHHVNHGIFWKPTVEQGVFFWEAWVKPYSNAEYVISDGYGGAHALLFGFGGGTTRLALTGNFWSNASSSAISFGSDETVPANQWCHIAVGWDGIRIVTFINGIPSGIVPYSGQRSSTPNSGSGVLFIGGSDHSNFNGKIARVRGFEGVLPVDTLLDSFRPERYFRSSYLKSNGDIVTASFLADYSTPSKMYPDLSLGFNGVNHIGVLSAGTDSGKFGFIGNVSNNLPVWTSGNITPPIYVQTPISVPSGATVYDSFSRADINPAFSPGIGLGRVEKGITPYKNDLAWRGTNVTQWGITQERSYNSGASLLPVYVETGVSNMDVRISRFTGAFTLGEVGLVYRYQNDDNYGYIYANGGNVYAVEKINGSFVSIGSGVQPELWNLLRVVANGNSVKVYCGGIQVISTTSNNLLTATKAGMIGTAGTGERFDDFTVFAPQ